MARQPPALPGGATHPHRSSTRLGLLGLTLLVLSASAQPSLADAQTCPALLMDFECAQYRQRLEHATEGGARAQIEHEILQIVDTRRRLCRSPEAQDWPRLRRELVQAGLSAELLHE